MLFDSVFKSCSVVDSKSEKSYVLEEITPQSGMNCQLIVCILVVLIC